MIKVIDIDQLKEGDILAEPLYNALGYILLPANAVICSNSLKLLKSLKIENVTIKNIDENNEDNTLTEEEIETFLKKILENLDWHPDNDYELELLKMAAIHKLKGKDLA
jgi:hypothetical protein